MSFLQYVEKFAEIVGTHGVGPAIFGAIAYGTVKGLEWWRNKLSVHNLKITNEKNARIQDYLIELRIKLDADRAYLTMFHNGTHYIDNSPILKKSRVSESVREGITFDAQYYQDIPVSLLTEEIKLVLEQGPSFRHTSEVSDGKFKRMLTSRHIYAVARCAVRQGSEVIGFLGVDYTRNIEKPENIDILCEYAGIIEQILTSSKD